METCRKADASPVGTMSGDEPRHAGNGVFARVRGSPCRGDSRFEGQINEQDSWLGFSDCQ